MMADYHTPPGARSHCERASEFPFGQTSTSADKSLRGHRWFHYRRDVVGECTKNVFVHLWRGFAGLPPWRSTDVCGLCLLLQL